MTDRSDISPQSDEAIAKFGHAIRAAAEELEADLMIEVIKNRVARFPRARAALSAAVLATMFGAGVAVGLYLG